MRTACLVALFVLPGLSIAPLLAEPPAATPSDDTTTCLGCHATTHPGLVADWQAGRHALVTPAADRARPAAARRLSAATVPEALAGHTVGCAECHTANAGKHADSFEHNGFQVHVVVTPEDCALCHAEERAQYAGNLMAHAYGNLMGNALYADLQRLVVGAATLDGAGRVAHAAPEASQLDDACLTCHGTKVAVTGQATRETVLGEMAFPVLAGWPNQGVGRINPDGSMGACTSCHTRHRFSLAEARKPDACEGCHKGPDVPAYKVWEVSKHGAIAAAHGDSWNWEAVPWTPGKDFSAPTCAACHVARLADGEGGLLAERTHRMNDRLPWRLFGLPYAHAHPISPDTTPIRNAAGLPLPTDLSGEPAASFLIDGAEQQARRARLQAVCGACHSTSWSDGHFARLEKTIAASNAQTRTATQLVERAWSSGLAIGPAAGGSPFDEAVERLWAETWLFHANSVRFAAAMSGADYGVFADGRWQLTRRIAELESLLRLHGAPAVAPEAKPSSKAR